MKLFSQSPVILLVLGTAGWPLGVLISAHELYSSCPVGGEGIIEQPGGHLMANPSQLTIDLSQDFSMLTIRSWLSGCPAVPSSMIIY